MPPKDGSTGDVRRQAESNLSPGIVDELDQVTFEVISTSSQSCLRARREYFATMISIGRAHCSNACTFNEFIILPEKKDAWPVKRRPRIRRRFAGS
jgi:hypothetical protein